MKLQILCEGKLREPHFRAACAEYEKRLARYLSVEIREVERITKLPSGVRIVALDERGSELTSREFSRWLGRILHSGARGLCFLLGGADGLGKDVLAQADERLSLSRLTLAHRLARVVLVEQIYRAMTILRGEPYHRD